MTPLQQTATALVHSWIAAVGTHDPSRVIRFYSQDAVLLGTFAKTIKQGHAQLLTYFRMFLAKPDLAGELVSLTAQQIPNGLIASGLYTFRFREGRARKSQIARFSFVFQTQNNLWVIRNHHSSVVP